LRLAQPEPRTAQNELRAIKKLCNGTNKNIIKVFEFGNLSDTSHAFIDMELCSHNLDQYNQSIRTIVLVHPSARNMRIADILSIVMQIANGLTFIHQQREIHRDLKPQNGSYLRPWVPLMKSPVFLWRQGMEGCGLWPHFRGDISKSAQNGICTRNPRLSSPRTFKGRPSSI
jgi:hypothetical protein